MIHFKRHRSILCAILQMLLLPSASALSQSQAQLLETGKPVEREMEGAGTHSYTVSLASGQYLRVAVEQRGIDVAVALIGPDGTKLNEIDSPNGLNGPELLSVIADKAGLYRLDISSLDKKAPRGLYEVKIEELRQATPQDQSRIAAEKNFAEAVQLHLAVRSAAAIGKALEKYRASLEVWREANEPRMEAMTLGQIGRVYAQLNEKGQAIDYFNQALNALHALGDRSGEADVLHALGRYCKQWNEKEKAIDFHERSLAIYREIGDRSGEALLLCDTGHIYFWFGNPQKALGYHTLALPLARALGNQVFEAAALMGLGLTYWALGEQEKALENYQQALLLYRAMGNREQQAETLTNMGLAYSYLSEAEKSLDAYEKALEIWRAIKHGAGQARTLIDIGMKYIQMGQPERALNQFEQALKLGDAAPVGYRNYALTQIGEAYVALGDKQKAIDYFNQALRLSRETADPGLTAHEALRGLGDVYYSLGEYEKALDYFNQMLSLKGMTNRVHEPIAHFSIGMTYRRLGDKQKAMEEYRIALNLWRDRKNRIGEANVLISMADVEYAQGNLEAARSTLEAALKLDEEVRLTKTNEQSRASFYSLAVTNHYEFYLDLLIELHKASPSAGYDRAALEVSERTRERALLDLLAEDRDRIRQGIDAELIERERDLRRRLLIKAAQQESNNSPQQALALSSEIEHLLAQYRDVEATIRAKSPRYAALTQPQTLAVADIQKLLDPDTLLLEYFLGNERSFVWAVTATSLSFHELPKRGEIRTLIRRFYDSVTARNKRIEGETASAEQARIAQAKAEFHQAADELSRLLLGPVAGQLGNRRLLIVADGALQYIPFAALPSPADSGQKENSNNRLPTPDPRPLIADHEIVSLPSISTISILRREAASRQMAPRKVAVIADPVFSNDDARLLTKQGAEQAGGATERSNEKSLRESLRDTGLTDAGSALPRLINTRREALSILALAEIQSRKRALDFDASRATASSPEMGQYRIIHFATHGLLNDIHPELSGLVLSLVDEKGNPQDGFLRLIDIYNLNLPVEMIVLSACRTGLGKEIRGEGLVGLTRGFMYAGASRVTASLWKVDDRATAELMKRFYEAMLVERLSPAAALRQAQTGMWKQRQWQDPYYWAAFVLYGEWK